MQCIDMLYGGYVVIVDAATHHGSLYFYHHVGTIASSFGSLSALVVMALDHNKLTGAKYILL